MKRRINHTRNFIIVFSLSILATWFVMPRAIRRAIQPHVFAAAKTFTVNVTGNGADVNPGDGICETSVAGNCSLRAAIEEANANSGTDTINFKIPGAGVHTISPTSALPTITEAVIIDGYSQPGTSQNTQNISDNAVLLVELSGTNEPANVTGLTVKAPGTTIQGLVINRFSKGLSVQNPDLSPDNIVQGNFIGTDPTGTIGSANTQRGVEVLGNRGMFGGTTPAARNIISGNGGDPSAAGIGILMGGSESQLRGNFIGIDATGTKGLGNTGNGVQCNGDFNNVVAGNVISGNGRDGIDLGGGSIVQQNLIGTNAAGTAAIGNSLSGIVMLTSEIMIGGPSLGNVISGNLKYGVEYQFELNSLQGNFIGTDLTGQKSLGNVQGGVRLSNTQNAVIGGTTAGSGNLISGNGSFGIQIDGTTNFGNSIQGNFIGTAADGVTALGNAQQGILINNGAINNTIGGPIRAGNLIAFNNVGVQISDVASKGNAVLSNSILSNTSIGIDLGADGLTPNDPGDGDSGPDNLQNFPTISSALTNGGNTIVTGSMDSTHNTGITIQFFANSTCDPSGNGEGQTFLGSINSTTGADGHFMFSATMMNAVPPGQFITSTATDSANNTSEFSQCVQVTAASPSPTPTPTPTPSTLQFGQAFYSVFEDCTTVTITVAREGSTANSASVDYATQAGTANERADYNTAIGTLNFAPGETAKSFDVLINEDTFVETTESFTVALSNPSGATLGSVNSATVQIFDDSPESAGNSVDAADDFIGQHYHDFLNRQADSAGLAFWTNTITNCGSDAACIQSKRVNASGAFFLSIEFQETGGFAIRVQRAAFGKKSNDAALRISYTQFIHDARLIGDGVIFGQPGYDARLEANKQAFINQVVTSAAFTSSYASGLTADQFVDALFASAGVTPTSAERQAAINAFDGGGIAGRAAALRSVSDSNSLRTAELSPSFVLMQYFGYLRRNPTDAPDNNDNGYQFWLTKLNSFGGDFNKTEMVKAFILSSEYRSRFGNQ